MATKLVRIRPGFPKEKYTFRGETFDKKSSFFITCDYYDWMFEYKQNPFLECRVDNLKEKERLLAIEDLEERKKHIQYYLEQMEINHQLEQIRMFCELTRRAGKNKERKVADLSGLDERAKMNCREIIDNELEKCNDEEKEKLKVFLKNLNLENYLL